MEPVFGVFEIKKQPQDNYHLATQLASCNSIDLKKTLLHLLLVQCSPFRKSRPWQESCLQTKSMSSIKQYEKCITGKNVVVDDSHLKKPILGAQIPCDVRCTDLLLVDSTCSSKWEKNNLKWSFRQFNIFSRDQNLLLGRPLPHINQPRTNYFSSTHYTTNSVMYESDILP